MKGRWLPVNSHIAASEPKELATAFNLAASTKPVEHKRMQSLLCDIKYPNNLRKTFFEKVSARAVCGIERVCKNPNSSIRRVLHIISTSILHNWVTVQDQII